MNDYVRYEIEPPAELSQQYDRLIKQQLAQRQSRVQVTLANALEQLSALVTCGTRISQHRHYHPKKEQVSEGSPPPVLTQDSSAEANSIQGTIARQSWSASVRRNSDVSRQLQLRYNDRSGRLV